MNPALDDSFTVPRLLPAVKMRCGAPRVDPGGGGINVARILHVLDEPVIAVFPAGGYVGELLVELLDAEGVRSHPVPVEGETRESHHVLDLHGGLDYRFVLPGPTVGVQAQERCLEALRRHGATADYLVLSGSLPPGVTPSYVARVAEVANRLGARLVVDTSGEALCAARGAFLLKPSVRELEELVGRHLATVADQTRGAREALAALEAQVLVVSRGDQGVLLVTDEADEAVPALAGPVVSTVGAGDALVAGIVGGLCHGLDLARATRLGVACSAAMIGTSGTMTFTRADLLRFTDEAFWLTDSLAASDSRRSS